MSAISRTIKSSVDGSDHFLVVTRNDAKGKLTLSFATKVNGRNNVIASIALDARGWTDLLNCVALPPALPPGTAFADTAQPGTRNPEPGTAAAAAGGRA